MDLKTIRDFLDRLEKAIGYGLEVEINEDGTPKLIMPSVNSVTKVLSVWCKPYQVTDQNGQGQGYVMATVYSKMGAELVKHVIDAYTINNNPKRYTEITSSRSAVYSIEHIEEFIRIREAEGA